MGILGCWLARADWCATVRRAELHYALCGRSLWFKAGGLRCGVQDVLRRVFVLVGGEAAGWAKVDPVITRPLVDGAAIGACAGGVGGGSS